MFTGIVEEIGQVKNRVGNTLFIEAPKVAQSLRVGDSVAVNGCCLTAEYLDGAIFQATCIQETLDKTTLGGLAVGSKVNLESSLTLSKPIGGHIVQGHVDGTAEIIEKSLLENGTLFKLAASEKILHYVVKKGSICIDGVSLTVVDVDKDFFSFMMIPHTAEVTTLGEKSMGQKVNIEVDILGKYVEKLFR